MRFTTVRYSALQSDALLLCLNWFYEIGKSVFTVFNFRFYFVYVINIQCNVSNKYLWIDFYFEIGLSHTCCSYSHILLAQSRRVFAWVFAHNFSTPCIRWGASTFLFTRWEYTVNWQFNHWFIYEIINPTLAINCRWREINKCTLAFLKLKIINCDTA